ncbi:hypothetical protein BYT27DRAFT_6873048 [Phlegmacium glaucopus]|nr:hypothetical protein BYT27DRAFT_6873048 [Phlegmacium glaucopus]
MRRGCLSQAFFLCEASSPVHNTKPTTHGCTFDLGSRLGLHPGQETESPVEYDDDVPIDHIVHQESCCCGRISKNGLVFLVSRHHQEITIGRKFPEAISSVIMETSLGRFTCYTHKDRHFVHFDASTCSSNVPLIPNQNMDDILLSARGYYLISDATQSKNFVWRRCSNDSLEFLASGNFFGVPDAVIYMPRVVLERWKRLERFSRALHDAMISVLEDLHEPTSFAIALQNLPEEHRSSLKGIPVNTTAERLAACVCLYQILSRKKLIEMDFESFHLFTRINIADLTEAHQHFRSPAADSRKLFQTSQDRFMRLLRKYRKAENAGGSLTDTLLRDGLLGLLHSNRNNVSLVVFQGLLATVARWNCCRVLSRAREAPEEWIKFIVADDDDDIYMS